MPERISRREMLACGLAGAALLAGRTLSAAQTSEQSPAAPPRPDRSASAPTSPVAVLRCESYDPKTFRAALERALDLVGGIKPLVANKTVTIKINMTGMEWKPVFGLPAQETYQTQPNTLAALCAILNDAGAKQIAVVESLYWAVPLEKTLADNGWDVAAIKSAGGQKVVFEDTRNRGEWPQYSRFKVPWGGFIYPAFDLNPRYEKTDFFISLAKLKNHACAGVTGAIKNLFGITPCSIYGNRAPGEDALVHRTSMFHDGKKPVPEGHPAELAHNVPPNALRRVPNIVADIFGARPVDLGIVEGVRTIKGGEGYWNGGIALIEPKVLVVGRNGVCTDSVAAAVMGYDPQAPHGQSPFPGDNHLRLLASVGVGTNDIKRIEIAGEPLEKVVCPFGTYPPAKG
jgi:uncharacterized protein (DUF362 family)